jgi:hypothetical protein
MFFHSISPSLDSSAERSLLKQVVDSDDPLQTIFEYLSPK